MKKLFSLLTLTLVAQILIAQNVNLDVKSMDAIETTLDKLTLREQVAQLMMVAMYPKKGAEHEKEISKLVEEEKIGGLIVFQGTSEEVRSKLYTLQQKSSIPLLTSIDGEWGPGMRLSDAPSYPKAMALGAI